MKDKKRKKQKRRADRAPTPDQRSDRMTAADVAARIESVQEDLGDLLYEFRYLKRYSELEDVAYVAWKLDLIRDRCDRFAETGAWRPANE